LVIAPQLEDDMKRRQFFGALGFGSVATAAGPAFARGVASRDAQHTHEQGGPDGPVSGPLASATVTFGAWTTEPPLDRYPNISLAPTNVHAVVPFITIIKAGGTVNFVISGLHQVVVYAPGKTVDDVSIAVTRPTTGTPANVPLINDTVDRVFAGVDPSLYPRDRVEAVQFVTRGTHLVICGVLDHFQAGMFGYVKVLL
jgi:plastocyanin